VCVVFLVICIWCDHVNGCLVRTSEMSTVGSSSYTSVSSAFQISSLMWCVSVLLLSWWVVKLNGPIKPSSAMFIPSGTSPSCVVCSLVLRSLYSALPIYFFQSTRRVVFRISVANVCSCILIFSWRPPHFVPRISRDTLLVFSLVCG
jgi:hypothetical protein